MNRGTVTLLFEKSVTKTLYFRMLNFTRYVQHITLFNILSASATIFAYFFIRHWFLHVKSISNRKTSKQVFFMKYNHKVLCNTSAALYVKHEWKVKNEWVPHFLWISYFNGKLFGWNSKPYNATKYWINIFIITW